MGVPASPSGLRPFGVEPAEQSQAEPLVPNAASASLGLPDTRPLRLCGYCQSWNAKPCGNGCVWSFNDPTFEMLEKRVFGNAASAIEAPIGGETHASASCTVANCFLCRDAEAGGSTEGESAAPSGETPNPRHPSGDSHA